ncbi:MAG: hypothetical protein K0R41_1653 [Geminicoccaceae bacterium]|nr:hypothetical protein [Geminicoccaceae bacterium]
MNGAAELAADSALHLRLPEPSVMDLIRIIFAIILPPLGVFLQVGLGGHFWLNGLGGHFWLNILLTLLGYIPGIVHAIWIIARR